MAIAGVVLAAGRSERMGKPKSLLTFRGRTFVESVVQVLEAVGIAPLVVVAGADAAAVEAALAGRPVRVVLNAEPESQQIDSLRLGLRVVGTPEVGGVLVWPVDHPHIRMETIAQLADTFRREGAAVVAPSFQGRRGHPLIWGRATWEDLLGSEAAGLEGARSVAQRFAVTHVEVADPAVVDDIDTPGDYDRLIGGAASHSS